VRVPAQHLRRWVEADLPHDLGHAVMVAYEMNVIVQQVGNSLSASARVLPAESMAPPRLP
jgi:hypothetical protein